MLRILAALAAVCLVGGVTAPRALSAQGWNDERTRALVALATERRAQQLADTGLVDYRATAHGYLTFLAQLGEGFEEPPKILKADELALEVYWRAPDLSKQRIVGRRDTLLLPTDINYHRDHLGIVQNNFPDIIRLGDGDEVSDVPHPLSAPGLAVYDFAISDSLSLRLPDRTLEVLQVRVRPRDDTKQRVIGAVFIERGTGQVVRMALSFTRAAFLDRGLEDISIVLENGLVEGRFWLPRRQEIEIRRTGTWLDYPVRGIIRGRWEIRGYEVNVGIPPYLFRGPEIVQAPASELARHAWTGAILDSLPPDVRAVTDEDVRQVQEEARSLVRAQALAQVRGTSLAARAASDFVRVNRVEGLAVGAGFGWRFGGGVRVAVQGRYGIDDQQAKGRVTLGVERADGRGVELLAFRDHRDVGDEPEVSLARNTLAAQEFGSDYTQPYDVRAAGARVSLGRWLGLRWRVEGTVERHDALAVHASPTLGRYEPTVGALPLRATRGVLAVDRPTALAWLGTELRLRGELRGLRFTPRDTVLDADPHPRALRAALVAHIERPVGRQRLVLHTTAAAVGGTPLVPPQELVYLGGPTTGPGYEFHAFVGRVGVSQRVEWQFPVPFVPVPLGRFGRVPASATLAPFVQGVYLRHPAAASREGLSPSVGVGIITLFDLIRFDVARGLRDGRWTFSVDATRDLWRIL